MFLFLLKQSLLCRFKFTFTQPYSFLQIIHELIYLVLSRSASPMRLHINLIAGSSKFLLALSNLLLILLGNLSAEVRSLRKFTLNLLMLN